jgi:hypothetical protein
VPRPPVQGDPARSGEHQRGGAETEQDVELNRVRAGGRRDEEPAGRLEQHCVDLDSDQARRGERREDAKHEKRPEDQLGEPDHPGQRRRVRVAESLQVAGEAADPRPTPQPEHLLHPVSEEHPADGDPQQEKPDVRGRVPLQWPPRRLLLRRREQGRGLITHAPGA